MLILYPSNLPNSLMSPSSFMVVPLEFSAYRITSTNSEKLKALSPRSGTRQRRPLSPLLFNSFGSSCHSSQRKKRNNKDFPGGSDGKASACNAGDLGLIPGSGRSPGEGNRNPRQYSCLENSMDGGAWWTIQSMGLQKVGHD